MNKSNMTIWTVEEVVNDAANQYADKGLVDQEDVENFLDEIYDKVYDALSDIENIQGIESIEECKSKLNEVTKMF